MENEAGARKDRFETAGEFLAQVVKVAAESPEKVGPGILIIDPYMVRYGDN
jgi:hypothetical protein